MIFGNDFDEKWFDLKILNTVPKQKTPISCDGDLSLANQMDILIIAGWNDINEKPSNVLQQTLINAYERGATLVGLCYGTYALAYCGLLNGKKAATHWAGEQDFSLRFP